MGDELSDVVVMGGLNGQPCREESREQVRQRAKVTEVTTAAVVAGAQSAHQAVPHTAANPSVKLQHQLLPPRYYCQP